MDKPLQQGITGLGRIQQGIGMHLVLDIHPQVVQFRKQGKGVTTSRISLFRFTMNAQSLVIRNIQRI